MFPVIYFGLELVESYVYSCMELGRSAFYAVPAHDFRDRAKGFLWD
jgi:hypothetical protein